MNQRDIFKDNVEFLRTEKMQAIMMLISECIVFVALIMFISVVIVKFTPYNAWVKFIILFVLATINYDVFKTFIYTKKVIISTL